jgi:hypothetical protein
MEDPYKCMIGMLGIIDYTTCPCVACIQRSFEDEGLDGSGRPLVESPFISLFDYMVELWEEGV